MKVSTSVGILVGACLTFLLSPSLPTGLLNLLVGNKVGAAILLVVVLYFLRQDVVLALALFLAVAALFLEQRRRIVNELSAVKEAKEVPSSVENEGKPAPDLVPGEVHPSHDEPEVQDHGFEPERETGSNDFERVAESQDEKHPLETVPPYPEEVSAFLQAKQLGHAFTASNSA
jgi:hypothetical protein